MPLPNPRYGVRPNQRQLQRATDNITLTTRPGAGIVVRKLGNHYVLEAKRRKQGATGSGSAFFPCKITAHATLSSGSTNVGGGSSVTVVFKWKYAFTEMERTGDTVQVKSGGRSGTTTDNYAINEAEINHTVNFSWGQTINVIPYPVGHRPKAVGGANTGSTDQSVHSYDVIVEMQEVTEVGSGLTKYRFNKEWFHSGSCV